MTAKRLILTDLSSIKLAKKSFLEELLPDNTEYSGMTVKDGIEVLFSELSGLLEQRPHLEKYPSYVVARYTSILTNDHPYVRAAIMYLEQNLFIIQGGHEQDEDSIRQEYANNGQPGESDAEYFIRTAEARYKQHAKLTAIHTKIAPGFEDIVQGIKKSFDLQASPVLKRIVSAEVVGVLSSSERTRDLSDLMEKVLPSLVHAAIVSLYHGMAFKATNENTILQKLIDEVAFGGGLKAITALSESLGLQLEIRAGEGSKKHGVWAPKSGQRIGVGPLSLALIDLAENVDALTSSSSAGATTIWGAAIINNRDTDRTGFIALLDDAAYIIQILSSKPSNISIKKTEQENLVAIAEAHGKNINELKGSMLFRERHYKMLMNMVLAGVYIGKENSELMALANEVSSIPEQAQNYEERYEIFLETYDSFWNNLSNLIKNNKTVELGNLVIIRNGTVEEALGICVDNLDFVIDTTGVTEAISVATLMQSFGKGGSLEGKTHMTMRLISQQAPIDMEKGDHYYTSLITLQKRLFNSKERLKLRAIGLDTKEKRNRELIGGDRLIPAVEIAYLQGYFTQSRSALTNLNIPGVRIDDDGKGTVYLMVSATGIGTVLLKVEHETEVMPLLNLPKNEQTIGDLAMAWSRLGRIDKAINIINKGLNEYASSQRLKVINLYLLGLQSLTQEDIKECNDKALAYFIAALDCKVEDARLIGEIRLILTVLASKLAEQAEEEAERSLDLATQIAYLKKSLAYYDIIRDERYGYNNDKFSKIYMTILQILDSKIAIFGKGELDKSI